MTVEYIYFSSTFGTINEIAHILTIRQNSIKLKELKSYNVFSDYYEIQLEISNRKISGNSQIFGIEQHTSK